MEVLQRDEISFIRGGIMREAYIKHGELLEDGAEFLVE